MKIDELKAELKEKENELKRDENGEICLWEEERETIRKEISALKKGISACEEILNSQESLNGNKANTSPTAPKNVEELSEVGCDRKSLSAPDTQTLIKQALSQRNKEILEKLTFEIKRQSAHRVINGNASEHDKRLFIHAEEIGREMERELVLRIIEQQLTNSEGENV